MLCDDLPHITGIHCTPLDDAGERAMIETPLRRADGDGVMLYAERLQTGIRFTDACETLLHLHGLGLPIDSDARLRPLLNTLKSLDLNLNAQGEIEAVASHEGAPDAFARMLRCMVAVADWERELSQAEPDAESFIEEVAAALRAVYGHGAVSTGTSVRGVTGRSIAVDARVGDQLVFTCRPGARSAASALHKIIDVNNGPEAAAGAASWVVIDDRADAAAAQHGVSL